MKVLVPALLVVFGLFLYVRQRGPQPPPHGDAFGPPFAYVDVAASMGLAALNQTGRAGSKRLILEAMAPGVAVGDFDNDGWMDLYLPNGNTITRYDRVSRAVTLMPDAEAPRHALYWNRAGERFEEGGAEAGVDAPGWAFGVVVGDVDNDGWADLYVCHWGPNRLYRNRGDGTFEEIGGRVGVAGEGADWSTGACLFDYDRDGDLDLYVAQYADVHDLLGRPELTTVDADGVPDGRTCTWRDLKVYCGPVGLRPLNDLLWRNLLRETGSLRFENVSEAAGITFRYSANSATAQSAGPFYGFQPVAWDIDGDGWQDLLVANDSVANCCWINRGDGTFVERALAMSLAVSQHDLGPQASMGVAVGDLNRDGLQDIVMTEFSHDQFNLLLGHRTPDGGRVLFDERAARTGFREMTLPKLGWGALLLDPDHDRDLDIFLACGHVYPEVDNAPDLETSYRQLNLLVATHDAARPRIEEIGARAGPGLQLFKCSRAAARLDFDNDGDPDILVGELNDTPSLLRCDLPGGGPATHWLQVRLRGNPAAGVPADPAGSEVRVMAGGVVQTGILFLGSSFLSSEDPRLHFGLGEHAEAEWVEVRWTNGSRTRLDRVAGDRIVQIACPLK